MSLLLDALQAQEDAAAKASTHPPAAAVAGTAPASPSRWVWVAGLGGLVLASAAGYLAWQTWGTAWMSPAPAVQESAAGAVANPVPATQPSVAETPREAVTAAPTTPPVAQTAAATPAAASALSPSGRTPTSAPLPPVAAGVPAVTASATAGPAPATPASAAAPAVPSSQPPAASSTSALAQVRPSSRGTASGLHIQRSAGSSDAGLHQAWAALQQQQWAQAREAFESYLQQRPDVADAWFGFGQALQNLQQHEQAALAYRQALSLHPQHEGARLGWWRHLLRTQPEQAALDIAAYLHEHPYDPQAHAFLGAALAAQRRWIAAAQAYEQAAALSTGAAASRLRFNAAVAWDHAGQGEAACRLYRQVAELPVGDDALRRIALQRCQQLEAASATPMLSAPAASQP